MERDFAALDFQQLAFWCNISKKVWVMFSG
jgi:hypothetical protein